MAPILYTFGRSLVCVSYMTVACEAQKKIDFTFHMMREGKANIGNPFKEGSLASRVVSLAGGSFYALTGIFLTVLSPLFAVVAPAVFLFPNTVVTPDLLEFLFRGGQYILFPILAPTPLATVSMGLIGVAALSAHFFEKHYLKREESNLTLAGLFEGGIFKTMSQGAFVAVATAINRPFGYVVSFALNFQGYFSREEKRIEQKKQEAITQFMSYHSHFQSEYEDCKKSVETLEDSPVKTYLNKILQEAHSEQADTHTKILSTYLSFSILKILRQEVLAKDLSYFQERLEWLQREITTPQALKQRAYAAVGFIRYLEFSNVHFKAIKDIEKLEEKNQILNAKNECFSELPQVKALWKELIESKLAHSKGESQDFNASKLFNFLEVGYDRFIQPTQEDPLWAEFLLVCSTHKSERYDRFRNFYWKVKGW